MRLTYNLLWIENEEQWLKPTKEFVEEIIDENGFRPNIQVKSTEADIEELLKAKEPLKEYDLILVDYMLDKGDQGSLIIQNIRAHNVYTEVMFYSQDSQGIRTEVSKFQLDGVYCSSRNRAEFEDKFERIFKVTVKKIQHISSMRGLVMAETSELDELLVRIIQKFYNKYADQKESDVLYEYIIKKVKSSLKSRTNKFERYQKEKEYFKLSEDFGLFDSDKKMYALAKILDILKITQPVNKTRFINEYQSEVIKMRNELAHAKEEFRDGKMVLVSLKGEEEFTEEKCITIRNNLKKHTKYLNDILGTL